MKKRTFGSFVVVGLVLILTLAGVAEAQAPLNWQQKNTNGFGNLNNAVVSALEVFGGQLYAGTQNDYGAEIWRSSDGSNWAKVTTGFDNLLVNGVIFDLIVFNGQLYAGTGGWAVMANEARIYRSSDGSTWTQVTGGWSADPNNRGMTNFTIFGNQLYASTLNRNGLEIWRSATGNSNEWERVVTSGFGGGTSYWESTGLTVFNGYLYAAVEAQPGSPGVQIWRSATGNLNEWGPVITNGFGDANNLQTGGWAIHNGFLYVGTRNDVTGGQIWRSQDGVSWTPAQSNGFGDINNFKIEGMVSFAGRLLAYTDNNVEGTQVWASADGSGWQQANQTGFGTPNNRAVALWSNGAATFHGGVYLGTYNVLNNMPNGGQVWAYQLPYQAYLPLAAK